ncbi:CDGSH iron-sulfur domain-containing protein [Halocatena marina]|nr:CDGSH iron-sulfur domain-containing protein [Halocatena marina]
MVREITHAATEPRIITPDDLDEEKGDIAICLCGLSADYPFCDGSHQATQDEKEGVRYKYECDDDENPRHVIDHEFETVDEQKIGPTNDDDL